MPFSNTTVSPSTATIAQSLLLVSSIVSVPAEVSPGVQTRAAAFATQATSAVIAVAEQTAEPLPAPLLTTVLNIVSSAMAAATQTVVNAGSGAESVAAASQADAAATTTAVAAALLSQGSLIGVLPYVPGTHTLTQQKQNQHRACVSESGGI